MERGRATSASRYRAERDVAMTRIMAILRRLFGRPRLRPGAVWKSTAGATNLALGIRRLET